MICKNTLLVLDGTTNHSFCILEAGHFGNHTDGNVTWQNINPVEKLPYLEFGDALDFKNRN